MHPAAVTEQCSACSEPTAVGQVQAASVAVSDCPTQHQAAASLWLVAAAALYGLPCAADA